MTAEYRWATSTITKAALEASSAYLLENFTVASDQVSKYLNPWGPPNDNGSTYPHYARYAVAMDGSQRKDGFVDFDWVLPYCTEGMVYYIENTKFGGADYVLSTVKTLARSGAFEVYQCTALLPVTEGEHFIRGDRGLEQYRIRYRQGTLIT